ncbi:MAG: signal peptidase I [Elusimicrobiota bacterium]|jgi:signal peptidase I|nr:signal peptidase I [Elusimicrobiota bacterium]
MEMELKLFIAGIIFLIAALIMLFVKKIVYAGNPPSLWIKTYSFVDTAWTALLIASVIMFLFIQAFKIPSGSMRNTLLEGDHLFVNKFIYGFHIPLTDGKRIFPIRKVKRGDIIVFRAPQAALSPDERANNIQKDFIKRCVGIPGDIIEVKDKKLFVNGIEQIEPYAVFGDPSVYLGISNRISEYQQAWASGHFTSIPVRDNFGPVTVPQGHYMMMGDNRDFSFDSRFFGPVPDNAIKGKALFLYWPLTRIRIIK